jgi:hypothetical protein
MVYLESHIEGRTRLKFPNLYEKESFIDNVKDIKGLKKLDASKNNKSLTVLVEYEPSSQFHYILRNIVSREPARRFTKNDLSSYVSPVLSNPIAKAAWLILVLGPTVGFLQFSISAMIVNRYIKAKFG